MSVVEEYVGTLTTKGQVTVPLAVRQRLGIKPGGKVLFRVVDDRVELLPPPLNLADTFGAVKPIEQPEDFQTLRDQAIEDHVRQVAWQMQE